VALGDIHFGSIVILHKGCVAGGGIIGGASDALIETGTKEDHAGTGGNGFNPSEFNRSMLAFPKD
jgi:hypothetical protein